MAKSFLVRAVFLFLLCPAVVSGALLDDYYLNKFGVGTAALKGVTAAVAEPPLERCRTHLYRSLKRDWPLLEPATRSALAKYVSRPALADPASHLSPRGLFLIHYARSGADAPNLSDLDADQVPDWVERVALVFDEVYGVEVESMGYQRPPVTRYDVYLKDMAATRTYGITTNDGEVAPPFPQTSVGSYIEIDKAFTDERLTQNRYAPDQLLQITAAHEFHHAIQFGYNYYFDFWYAEATATWIEDEVYEPVNQLYDYLPSYLPKAATLSLDAPLGNNSEYGRWIFNRYLAERHSSALIKEVWVRLGATPAPADGNDIPMLPVIDTALRGAGNTLADAFNGFSQRIYLRDWASHGADLGRIPVVAPQATYSSYPLSAGETGAISTTIATLPRYGFAFYKFLPGQGAPAELRLTFSDVPARIEMVALKKGSTGSVERFSFNRPAGTVTVPSFNAADTVEVQLIITSVDRNPASGASTASSSDSGGGGCFIATAAYGSYLHPKVAELRAFRDRHLLTNAPGRLFVSLYYRFSPPLARLVGEHDWLRAAARGALVPVVLTVEYPAGSLLLLLSGGGALLWRQSRRRSALKVASARG